LDAKLSSNEQRASQEAEDELISVGNLTDLSSWGKKKIRKNIRLRLQRPSGTVAKRSEVEEASPPQM